MEKPWYFIQLSDTHIVADTRQEFHGVNTYATLSRAIAQVNDLDPPPAFVIITGDLINDDDPQSYGVLQQLTDQLRVPTYFTLGNHDLRQPFRQVCLGEQQPGTMPYYYTFDKAQYRFIVLDSLVEGEVGGALDVTQLDWLETTLATAPTRPTIVFVHHPPAPTGIDWLDAHVITNGAALLAVLARHRQVRRVFFGHVHTALHITAHGVQCTSVPATCYQFGDLMVTPKVFAGPPGYGVVVLRDEQVSSRVTYF
jgi:3',5'-cyclic AMP phosphodiesterase CpdA